MPSVAVWLLRRDAPDMPRPYRALARHHHRRSMRRGGMDGCGHAWFRAIRHQHGHVRTGHGLFRGCALCLAHILRPPARGPSWHQEHPAYETNRRHADGIGAGQRRLPSRGHQPAPRRKRPGGWPAGYLCRGRHAHHQRRIDSSGHDRAFGAGGSGCSGSSFVRRPERFLDGDGRSRARRSRFRTCVRQDRSH